MIPFDPEGLLGVLIGHQVDFVVTGGIAATLHGSAHATTDLDITYERSRENIERLARALHALDARMRSAEDMPIRIDARLIHNGNSFTFSTRLGDFDCLATPTGAPPYAQVRSRADMMMLGPHHVYVASLDDLITMKRAAGRPKDLNRLPELLELRKLIEQEQRGNQGDSAE